MNRAEVLFKLIDIVGRPLQNTVKIDGITSIKDISYGENDYQKLDVYYREADRAIEKPVVVYFHGGGFVKGGKKYRRSISEILANMGYFVVNADYRLSPEFVFPSCVADAISAINYLPVLSKTHKIDLNRVAVCGDSSGGYLASFVTAAFTSTELRKRLSLPNFQVKIRGLIAYCGVFDVAKMIAMREPFGIARKTGESLMGIKLKHNLSNIMEYKYLDCISAVDLINRNWPKTLIVHGAKDIICPHQGDAMVRRLDDYGVSCAEYKAKSFLDNHCFQFHYWRNASKEALAATDIFLKSVFEDSSWEDVDEGEVRDAENPAETYKVAELS